MLKTPLLAVVALALLAGAMCAAPASAVPHDPIPFLPGERAREFLFAGAAFSPDGRSVYFTRYAEFTVEALKTIMVSHRSGALWSEPEPAPFSGQWSDTTPFVAPAGDRLYFASNRPVDGKTKEDFDLWFVDRKGEGWGEPRPVSAVNSSANETSPSVSADGVLYFCSWREEGGMGLGDLWSAEPTAGGFAAPRNLGAPINGPTGEWGVTVSANGQLMVFESSGRPEGLSGAGDLYLSRRVHGAWTPPVHLKAPINSAGSDLAPRLSADGEDLYFASTRSGRLQMWRVALPAASKR